MSTIAALVQADDDTTTKNNWYAQAKESYENLPEQGKFATGAVCGFGASKVVVNSGEYVCVCVHVRTSHEICIVGSNK